MSGVGNPRAFPNSGGIGREDGMSLRDWFAGQALSTVAGYSPEDVATWVADDFATHAYMLADAMLAARTKGGES